TIVWIIVAFAVLLPAMAELDPSIFAIDRTTGLPLATNEQMSAALAPMFGRLFAAYGAMALLLAAYNIVLWAWAGGTLGQRALGMQVRRESDGGRIGFWRACLRFIGYLVAWIPFGIGLLWVGLDPRKQGWHDKIAGTFVIRRA
ncbi:MAG TPA: RDD family protein, partial [Candidatus Eisenbacteria bacterium]|nr:RDD family protein [Candidatus Eisenbacteria bacterium]